MENLKTELNLGKSGGDKSESSIEEVCVKLGVPQLRVHAIKLFQSYKNSSKALNIERPVFKVASTLVAAKASKLKLDSRKAANLALATKPELDRLVKDIEESEVKVKKSNSDKRRGDEDSEFALEQEPKVKQRRTMIEDDEDDLVFDRVEFEAWKANILRQAGLTK